MHDLAIDPQFFATCAQEGIDPVDAALAVQQGTLVFLRSEASRHMTDYRPLLVGAGTRRKVAGLIGLGPRDSNRQAIVESMSVILAAGPDSVMDLTTNPEGVALRADLKEVVGVPLGACLTYDLFASPRKKFGRNEFLDRFEMGLAPGVDFVLIHAGINPGLAEMSEKSDRIMPTTSRGGGLLARYMRMHDCNNPLIEFFDGIIDICKRREVVLDLGDIFRPGATADAGDELKWREILLLSELRKDALASGVQVLCESGGHIPLHRIPELIPAYKDALGGAPLWLAGPMVVDNAVTLDSIVNTIGVATAGQHGGDMFASITQVEHYAMPGATDTAEAIRNVRVAITALDLVRSWPPEVERQRAISVARRANDWDIQQGHALYPGLAGNAFIEHGLRKGAPCTICGSLCPHITAKKEHDETPVPAMQSGPVLLSLPMPVAKGEHGLDGDANQEDGADAVFLVATSDPEV
ncbi:phosphomethylpyrimidine synthase ThiC [Nocardia sp. NBC_00508]|uniref:phosphomethylpyrimidine synthase ThiC n=1 Tax=Nocardia sp. NBC_00508 TaxID=2975992 RepID=UPI002E81F2FE|nr:phosphomethylpyrimidine synthase ThiC [Nocardia sp. NBC_00508]WUD67024.1 phosphomethylpyrimidine synthase ThiC [Nocardia sp. NBC_00508]